MIGVKKCVHNVQHFQKFRQPSYMYKMYVYIIILFMLIYKYTILVLINFPSVFSDIKCFQNIFVLPITEIEFFVPSYLLTEMFFSKKT